MLNSGKVCAEKWKVIRKSYFFSGILLYAYEQRMRTM